MFNNCWTIINWLNTFKLYWKNALKREAWLAVYKPHPHWPSAGVPQPDIVWYKDALPIDPVKTPRYRVLVGGSLQVNGLLPDDTGMFQCFARNLAGEVQTNTYLAVTSECSSSSSGNNFFSQITTVIKIQCVLLKHRILFFSQNTFKSLHSSLKALVRFRKDQV